MDFSQFNVKIDTAQILKFISGPLLTVIMWYALDRILIKLHEKSKFIERIFSRQASDPAKRQMIKQRVKTLRGLLLQGIRILNAIFFLFILLDHFKIDPKPLLAGIGVVGLGLSLAAQNILRDFINGIFIIAEDQFNVGDFVTIGSHSGTVESFTMRVTRLRAADGRLIIIPNSGISEVVNSTKDFAVAIVDVGVAYSSDIQSVMEILDHCARDAAGMSPGVALEDPKVLGIVAFRDNDVQLRTLVKTLPGEQWGVERNLRKIIKDRFDAEGIDIPLPQIVLRRPPEEETARNKL
ncbi:MAG: mechanosensitive ion channel family protein [Synergistaceae bacterium]|jgi:small conductance mechanosensitive channel|nr:mechanosensitive ion channel family protein [Synergistaceae bacterium]